MGDTLIQHFIFIYCIYFIQKWILKPKNKRGWRKNWLFKDSNNEGIYYEFCLKCEGSLKLLSIAVHCSEKRELNISAFCLN